MERQMFRKTLDRLKANNQLLQCRVQVDPKYELGAVLEYFGHKQPIEFTSPKGTKSLLWVECLESGRSIMI